LLQSEAQTGNLQWPAQMPTGGQTEYDTVRLRSAVGLLGEGPASMSAVPTQMVFPGSGSRGKSGKMGIVPRCRSLEPLVSPGSPSSPLYIS
uniref:Uncharacterized protein n=1 Tax=Neolamprologus brichardi TaxID=32507 RepID=A0A3Q4N201_NEOBR